MNFKSNVLITGNLGYIGTVLTDFLLKKNYFVKGLDSGLFKDCLLDDETLPHNQILKDIRDVTIDDFKNFKIVVYLSAISNDPLGEFNKKITNDINFIGAVKFAKKAKASGVKKFIFISSQSMYGISDTEEELDEDNSEKNPITEYAKTKWEAEKEILKLNDLEFTTVSLRPSTVFGSSPRLRCDIVFNNLLACAFTTKEIIIKSDGSPWRPVIHIKDVCNAIYATMIAPKDLVSGKSFNIGIPNGNFTVKEIAETVKQILPDSKLRFTGEHTDSRTYKVSFKKILTELKDYYKPEFNLLTGGKEMLEFFKKIKFSLDDFQGFKTNRITCLKKKYEKIIDNNFRVIK